MLLRAAFFWGKMMTSPKIALFANKDSAQLRAIGDAVREENGSPLIFDIQLGGESAPDVCIEGEHLMWGGIDFSDINVIHIRCTSPNTLPSLPPVMNPTTYSKYRTSYFQEQEYQSAIFSFFEQFTNRGGLVINSLITYIDHDSKSQFYEKMRSQGFDVPRSLTTNDPEEALEFIDRIGHVVVKPAIGIGSTRIMTSHDRENIGLIKHCPLLLQEQIMGNTVRVHFVGDKVVLALRIHSSGGVDSRTETEKFDYFKLPDEEEARIVSANRFLGLHYAAWDIIVAGDNRCVYLDCNPGPYVMWIGPLFRKFVFKQLARYMITYANTGCLHTAASKVECWKS